MASKPKGESGKCTACNKEIGVPTKHPCFYTQDKVEGFIVWRLLCRECKEHIINSG